MFFYEVILFKQENDNWLNNVLKDTNVNLKAPLLRKTVFFQVFYLALLNLNLFGPNLLSWSFVAKIWTMDSKLQIQEGFKSVIQIWTVCRQFSNFIKFGPWTKSGSGIKLTMDGFPPKETPVLRQGLVPGLLQSSSYVLDYQDTGQIRNLKSHNWHFKYQFSWHHHWFTPFALWENWSTEYSVSRCFNHYLPDLIKFNSIIDSPEIQFSNPYIFQTWCCKPLVF